MATSPTQALPQSHLNEGISYQVTIAATFVVLLVLCTALRTWSRHLQRASLYCSDISLPISLLLNLGPCTCAYLDVRWGSGRYAASIGTADLVPFTILHYHGVAPTYLAAVTFSKLVILDLYLHIFIQKFFRNITYGLGLVIVSSLVANFITVMAQCRPMNTTWNPGNGGYCHNLHAHYTWSSLPNIVTDVAMLILPIPMIVKLHQSWRVKLGVLFNFLVRSIGLITSVVRLIPFYEYGWASTFRDASWFSATIPMEVVEPGVYHLAACFITLRPLLRWILLNNPLPSFFSCIFFPRKTDRI